jgi:hypothetical protein
VESPHFFVDRSLGAVRVPQLPRNAGWLLRTLVEHYGKPADESVADVDWLALPCGEQGWPVLMKDEKIRYRTAEREALVEAGVTAFSLTSGNLRSAEMAEVFIRHRDVVWGRRLRKAEQRSGSSPGGRRGSRDSDASARFGHQPTPPVTAAAADRSACASAEAVAEEAATGRINGSTQSRWAPGLR